MVARVHHLHKLATHRRDNVSDTAKAVIQIDELVVLAQLDNLLHQKAAVALISRLRRPGLQLRVLPVQSPELRVEPQDAVAQVLVGL